MNSEITITSGSPTQIQLLDDGRYVEEKGPDLYFVMERLREDNLNHWLKFSAQNQKKARKYYQEKQDNISKYILSGAIGFADTLQSFALHNVYAIGEAKSPHEVWILLACIQAVKPHEAIPYDTIETCCTVSTAANVPFTNHMGICRTTFFIEGTAKKIDGIRMHPNTSMGLHSHGVKVMLLLYPEKIYMITTPMPSMQRIFIRALGEDNVYIAFKEDWVEEINECKTAEDEERREHYKSKIASSGSHPLLTIGKNNSSFKLLDLKGATILDITEEQMKSQYRWFFDKETTFSPFNDTVVIPLALLKG